MFIPILITLLLIVGAATACTDLYRVVMRVCAGEVQNHNFDAASNVAK